MGFGNIKHISSIKYKGRYKQKSIDEAIKKVNIAIDKFNESNYDISDKMLNYASKRLEELINKKIPGYYGMLLKAQNQILYGNGNKGGIFELIKKNDERRINYFQKIIDSWSKNPKISLSEIESNINSVMSKLDSVTESEISALEKSCDKFIDEKITELKKKIGEITGKKLSQLSNKCNEWITESDNYIAKLTEGLAKMKALQGSIKNLKEITKHGRGKLEKEDIAVIEDLIKSNDGYKGRGWVKGKIEERAIYESNEETNRLLLSLMAIFTDRGSDKVNFIESYLFDVIK